MQILSPDAQGSYGTFPPHPEGTSAHPLDSPRAQQEPHGHSPILLKLGWGASPAPRIVWLIYKLMDISSLCGTAHLTVQAAPAGESGHQACRCQTDLEDRLSEGRKVKSFQEHSLC